MRNLKIFGSRMLFAAGIAAAALLSSCKSNDNNPTFAAPTITVSPSSAQQAPDGTVTLSIAVAADAGLASVKVGDTDIKTYTGSSTKGDAFSYDYTVASDATPGDITLTFTVTDAQSTPMTATATATITVTETPKQTITVDASISTDQHWTADNYYLLKGNIYVQSGATLTIDPGTIIFGDKVTKGSLVIDRGGKIMAVGTADNPIIFTSSAPKTFRNYGDWGGVILLGKAKNNQSTAQQIEGISATGTEDGLYGGTSDSDNSGKFEYARIEFAGIALSTDNEINGLTFGSVGSGTKVDHVQVSFSGDDSYEWFGGAVHVDHLVAFRGWDDEYDTDFGFHGSGQFLLSVRDPNIADKSGSNGFESDNDGNGSTNTPLTSAIFANVTYFGPFCYAALNSDGSLKTGNVNNNFQHGAHIRRNTALRVYNTAFVGTGLLDGVYFQNTNVAAEFKGNFFGRLAPTSTISPDFLFNHLVTYTDDDAADDFVANFAANNPLTNTAQIGASFADLSADYVGLGPNQVGTLTSPMFALAADSPLKTGAVSLPSGTGLTDVDYVGCFSASETTIANSWMNGWTNFDPNNTDY